MPTCSKGAGAAALLALALLAGCQRQAPEDNQAANVAVLVNEALENTIEAKAAASNQTGGVLIPPAPGEPGGLPDDRGPLAEGRARNPGSVEAAGTTIEQFGIALSDGRFADAYRLWEEDGKRSGMSEARFTEAYRRYSEIHVLVGRPEASGARSVRVPVQIYGRLKASGKPFNLLGTMSLRRNPRADDGEPGQPSWLIAGADLKPSGAARIVPAEAAEQSRLIPVGFQGRWSETRAACGKPGDMSRLTIDRDRLIFYESEGKVTGIALLGLDEIRVDARYEGEGESWSKRSRLRLADGGQALTLDGMKRVRCA